ncbi:OVARIAN TUMOR DOMAIN-containing deubiquitinating enzyme 12-like isoform X1 [Typha latifolia]|uniref:OVARIAN TUMOR DOMAIN-containing deubiquitinating enzyme 12-like isoform X1 n=1 Tax=Typha latifolia TaxID=4733 RepID=UPI003C2BCA5C
MIMREPDPDVLRWGLHLLQGDPCADSTEYGNSSQIDASACDEAYISEISYRTDRSIVENDEIIAHALQEEFSQVAVAESSGPSHADEQHLHASVLTQDWSMNSLNSGNKPLHEEREDMEPSSSCTSPEENLHDGDARFIELTEDFSALDGEVGKRLNRMVPVPHVPKINGEMPSIDEATSDHQRLLERLKLYDLVELKVQGDGNCQFRALSDQFYRTTEHHKFVRQQVVNQLKSRREIYEGYVPMAYDGYLKKMSKSGEWGDHVTLQAAADSYGVKIFILTSFKDTCYIEILPDVQKSKRVIFLSFWAEVHYNSIYPEGDFPISEIKKNKRHFILEQCSTM